MMAPEVSRLDRALALAVEPLGDGRWRVTGGTAPHVVTGEVCDCADFRIRGTACKHLVAVRLRQGSEELLQAVRQLVGSLRSALKPTRRKGAR